MKYYATRLLPGQDLKIEIAQLCVAQKLQAAGIISSVGSLKQLSIRLAHANKFMTKKEYFEILSLNGTVTASGIHLHLSVADAEGHCWGGHLQDGNIIYTTCELIVVELEDLQFIREDDAATGFKELLVKKRN